MMKYDKYVDSGVDWLGLIPEHWKILRIKDKIRKIGSGVTPKGGSEVYVDSGVTFLRSQNIYDNGLRIDNVSFIPEEVHKKMTNSQLKPNDILLNITGASIGRSCIVPINIKTANINQHIIYSRFSSNTVPYISMFYKTNLMKEYINSIQAGSSKEALNMGQLLTFKLTLPPLKEQQAIANYLDKKTTAIDSKISLLEKKVKYYKELRKSLINNAVTKGLNRNVKLRDSGVKWIGKIPKHWEVKRFKDVMNIFNGNSISDKSKFEDFKNAHHYISTKDIDFETGAINIDNKIYIPISNKKFKIARKNSTIICMEGANAGKKIGYAPFDLCFVNKLCALKSINKEIANKFFYYFSISSGLSNQFFEMLSGIIGGVSIGLMKNFSILIPSINEQKAIVKFLDKKIFIIDTVIKNIENQITTLKELRKVLINDVVTGKIKVS